MMRTTINTDNYNQILDSADWCKANNDAVFTQLLKDIQKEALYPTRESFIDAYFTAVKIYNLGIIRGKQIERSKHHRSVMSETFKQRPEIKDLFSLLSELPADQRGDAVATLLSLFGRDPEK